MMILQVNPEQQCSKQVCRLTWPWLLLSCTDLKLPEPAALLMVSLM